MIILGIDPGLALIGYGVLSLTGSQIHMLEYGAIRTPAHTPMVERLDIIDREMHALLLQYRPDEVAFEELFFYQNKTTAIAVAQARGVSVLAVHRQHVPLYEYTPSQIKQALTGYGKATKIQVQTAVQRLLHLDALPRPDDAADGLACAICHVFGQRFKEQNRMF